MGPNVAAYLASLPNGLASHPDCTVKASVVREILQLDPNWNARIAAAAPDELRPLLTSSLPPVSSWIAEVHANALFAAILDGAYEGDVTKLATLIHDGNVRLFQSALYRALFWLAGVDRVVAGAASRWSHMRKGSALAVDEQKKGFARLSLSFPTNLWPSFMLQMRAITFTDVLTVAGAKNARVDIESTTSTRAVFIGTWSAS